MENTDKLLKNIYEKFQELSARDIEYDCDSALEVLEENEDNFPYLSVWVDIEENEDVYFFKSYIEAVNYIENFSPEIVNLDFDDELIALEVVEYIDDTDDYDDSAKGQIVLGLCDIYLKNNSAKPTIQDCQIYLNTIKETNPEGLLELFNEDDEFATELILNYVDHERDKKTQLYVAPDENYFIPNNLVLISSVYRELILRFNEHNLNTGNLEVESVSLINRYLKSQFSLHKEYYHYYLNDMDYNEDEIRALLKFIIMEDCSEFYLAHNNEEGYFDNASLEYLLFLQGSSPKQRLEKFNVDDNFSKHIINDFILYNNTVLTDKEKNEKGFIRTQKLLSHFKNVKNRYII